ncbi:MAG TPA: hypothetical protein DCE25_10010 [Pseudomonas sp.]|nr:hypothetical protein [Pseudomonas sp.]
MSEASSSDSQRLAARSHLLWRLLFAKVLLLGAFLYLCLLGLAGYLLLLAFDAAHPPSQRVTALVGGVLILAVGGWLLRVALPRRVGPVLVEAEDR